MDSTLFLKSEMRNGKTYLKDVYYTAPYKIMSPFQRDHGIEVMMMCASAGLLGGDSFYMDLEIGENSDVLFTTQSYEKIFDSGNGVTKKNLEVTINPGGRLIYLPYPSIPFGGSNFYNISKVNLSVNSRCIYSDILSCGRVGMGERFQMKNLDSVCRVYVGGELVFAEHTRLEPDCVPYDALGLWQGYSHTGMLYVYGAERENEWIEKVRRMELPKGIFGITRCRKGVLLRALGKSGEQIYEFFYRVALLCT